MSKRYWTRSEKQFLLDNDHLEDEILSEALKKGIHSIRSMRQRLGKINPSRRSTEYRLDEHLTQIFKHHTWSIPKFKSKALKSTPPKRHPCLDCKFHSPIKTKIKVSSYTLTESARTATLREECARCADILQWYAEREPEALGQQHIRLGGEPGEERRGIFDSRYYMNSSWIC